MLGKNPVVAKAIAYVNTPIYRQPKYTSPNKPGAYTMLRRACYLTFVQNRPK